MSDLTTLPEEPRTDFLSRPLLAVLAIDWERALYILFVLTAIVTRFWALGARVVSHDESLHTQYSFQFYNGDGFNHTPLMHGPFLFHITALSYWLFGDNDMTARIPVAILGVILVAMPYLFRRWIGRVGALVASFLLLISPFVTYYARYIRHDTPAIVWALIIFAAICGYIYFERKDSYLWWFAAGLALIYATKEVSYIYTAIFGSFLLLRLILKIWEDGWLAERLGELARPAIFVALGAVLLLGGLVGQRSAAEAETEAAATATVEGEGFAADPNALATPAAESEPSDFFAAVMGWVMVLGVVVAGLGVFMAAAHFRPELERYPSFDLIVLFTVFVVPLLSPVLAVMSGWTTRDYSAGSCASAVDGVATPITGFWQVVTSPTCWASVFSSGIMYPAGFLVVTLLIAVLIGLWWDQRRFIIAAVIFHSIFLVLYTSVFTNMGGWFTGSVDSLAYWIEQQEVQRGNQPWFYYFFIVPFYEFLPLVFALAGIWRWSRKKGVGFGVAFLFGMVIGGFLLFSFTNWVYNYSQRATGVEDTILPGLIAALLLLIAVIAWRVATVPRRKRTNLLALFIGKDFELRSLTGFVPFVTYWLILDWALYSYAGEKMPWLSTHFVIPMALLAGWYLNDLFAETNWTEIWNRQWLSQLGLAMLFIVALFLAIGPLVLGEVSLSVQTSANLAGLGRFLGSLLVASGLFYLLTRMSQGSSEASQGQAWKVAIFTLLALLTIRFTYMANFLNYDYTNEFMVYAHGAPATKDTVMAQIDALSMRMYGDKSLAVAYDDDSTWPMTWYLREYPNRIYFGASPGRNILDAPVVVVGSNNWGKVEPILQDDYEVYTYTFLWWPMEEYRNISWGAVLGLDENASLTPPPEDVEQPERGLASAKVRRAVWDIFFYRDYEAYGEVFGGNYTPGRWPLRHDLRLFIRRDVLAQLWDYGIGAASYEPPVDPYAEGAVALQPVQILGGLAGAGVGQFNAPRNLAIAPNGDIYVADSGNHRIQVFDPNGVYRFSFGEPGSAEGQLNEPWSIAVDDAFVYVADTWNHRLQKFTLEGDFVSVIGRSGSPSDGDPGDGLFFGPRQIILLEPDQLLVSDTGNHRIQRFTRDGQFLESYGSYGIGMGEFYEPVGMAVSASGTIYLADTWNQRVQAFRSDLLPLRQWEVDAWQSESINNKPYLAVDNQGRVLVTDPEAFRVLVFSPEGDYLGRFGEFGTESGQFNIPNGIVVDSAGNIWIADSSNNRILKYAPLALGVSDIPIEAPAGDDLLLDFDPNQAEDLPEGDD
ncbi:MAG: TIGR03663 family protein [Anaerolineales bacterium]|nr:TIGR03663 family protein [Anaerolineales bacterium]